MAYRLRHDRRVRLAGTAVLSAADASRVALPVTVLLRLLLLAVVAWATVAIVAAVRGRAVIRSQFAAHRQAVR